MEDRIHHFERTVDPAVQLFHHIGPLHSATERLHLDVSPLDLAVQSFEEAARIQCGRHQLHLKVLVCIAVRRGSLSLEDIE